MKTRQLAGCQTLHCPTVYEVLSQEACGAGACPTVLQDGADLIVVGKTIDVTGTDLAKRVGPDETAVRISADLFMEAAKALTK